jgi:hypothetical protein
MSPVDARLIEFAATEIKRGKDESAVAVTVARNVIGETDLATEIKRGKVESAVAVIYQVANINRCTQLGTFALPLSRSPAPAPTRS